MVASVKELTKAIGKNGIYHATGPQYGLHFQVDITDVRQVYGRVDYSIRPVGGYGSMWVSSDKVSVDGN